MFYSTLQKLSVSKFDMTDHSQYPWYMVEYITIEDRNLLFTATIDLLKLLLDRVNNERDDVNLTPMLLKRVWRAALRCPGFTPAQKDDVICICNIDDRTAMELGMAPFASYWKYLWTIGPKPNTPADLLLVSCYPAYSQQELSFS